MNGLRDGVIIMESTCLRSPVAVRALKTCLADKKSASECLAEARVACLKSDGVIWGMP